VNEDLGNIQGEVVKLKEEMIVTRRVMGKELAASMKKDAPDERIAPLTKTCREAAGRQSYHSNRRPVREDKTEKEGQAETCFSSGK
jgi:hypothetical protein